MTRPVLRQHAAYRDDIGDLVTRRPLPAPGLDQLDPFLFLNHHGPQVYPPNNRGLPFGPHPHRGFETVTFILSGELAHLDSGGHESVIRAGGVQWMTAGSGLVHAELSPASFKATGGPLEILQLWVNLPARLKMTKPRYIGLQQADIPVIAAAPGAAVHLVSGSWGDQEGQIDSLTGLTMMTVDLAAGARIDLPAPAGETVFLYTVSGEAIVSGTPVPPHRLVEMADGEAPISVRASTDAHLLFGHGKPFNEPMVAHGPFVMNSREEIVAAIQDYQAGRFGAVPETA